MSLKDSLKSQIETASFSLEDGRFLIELIASRSEGDPIQISMASRLGKVGGAKGGKSTSRKKRAAGRASLEKARLKLAEIRAARELLEKNTAAEVRAGN